MLKKLLYSLPLSFMLLSAAFGSQLCTSFTPTITSTGVMQYAQAGTVCSVNGIQLTDLSYIWDYNPTTTDPGLVTISIDTSIPNQWRVVLTAANGWNQEGNGAGNVDLSTLFTIVPSVSNIVGAQLNVVGTVGWDPATSPATGAFTGEVNAGDSFTATGYAGQKSSTIADPSSPNLNGNPQPFDQTGGYVAYVAPPIGAGSTTTSLDSKKDILLLSGDNAGDTSSVTQINQIYYLSSPVPEPFTAGMAGAGLLVISLALRRKRKA
jgi:hypothetical protein